MDYASKNDVGGSKLNLPYLMRLCIFYTSYI